MLVVAGAALAATTLASPARAQPADLLAGAATGTLRLQLELSGSGRTNMPNGVEWASLKTSRKLSAELRMLDMANRNVAIVSNGKTSGAAVPAAMAAIEKAMAACNGDRACQAATMMRYAKDFQPKAYGLDLASDRYRNWAADRRTACATGRVSVHDTGEGVIISPPSPAAAYRFQRAGAADLQKQVGRLSETLCSAELTYDAEKRTVSLRLPVRGLAVPVTISGHAFTHEKSVPLIEGVNTVELFDQPVRPEGGVGGRVELPRLGSATHNSGQVAAPLRAVLVWHFSPD